MASCKHVLAVLAVILAIAAIGVDAAGLIQGNRESGDELTCTDEVHLPAQSGVSMWADRTCSGLPSGYLINRIEAEDQSNTGDVKIESGGLGKNNVKLFMWSKPGKQLHFTIKVYSKKY